MVSFKFELQSNHSPEEVWTGLNSVPPEAVSQQIYPHISLEYQRLSPDGIITHGTQLIGTPNTAKLGMLAKMLPEELKETILQPVKVLVDKAIESRVRIDIFEPNQTIQGIMCRSVKEGPENTGVLIVEGELAVSGLDKYWPSLLGDINENAKHYIVTKPNQKILELLPAILA